MKTALFVALIMSLATLSFLAGNAWTPIVFECNRESQTAWFNNLYRTARLDGKLHDLKKLDAGETEELRGSLNSSIDRLVYNIATYHATRRSTDPVKPLDETLLPVARYRETHPPPQPQGVHEEQYRRDAMLILSNLQSTVLREADQETDKINRTH